MSLARHITVISLPLSYRFSVGYPRRISVFAIQRMKTEKIPKNGKAAFLGHDCFSTSRLSRMQGLLSLSQLQGERCCCPNDQRAVRARLGAQRGSVRKMLWMAAKQGRGIGYLQRMPGNGIQLVHHWIAFQSLFQNARPFFAKPGKSEEL